MDFAFTPEQDELREQARAFLAANPEPTWQELAELGWTGVSVAEENGGAGLGFLEEAILFEEMGRALTHAPFWSTVAVVLPGLPADLPGGGRRGEASWTLANGPLVADLDTATSVATVGGDSIWELDGAEREMLRTNDETRPLGVVSGGEAGRQLCELGAPARSCAPARWRRSSLEACGVGARALELAVAYATERHQFGKPIGTYQAISHPLAATLMELELGRSLALFAAWCIAEGDERARDRGGVGEVALRGRRRRGLRARRSRCTAASASRGSTCCTGSTSARSGSSPGRRRAAQLRSEVAAICSTAREA